MKLIQTYNIAIKSGEFAGYYRMCGIDSMQKARCDKMTDAERVKVIRKRTGMTQAEFCEEFEIPRRTLENWESGSRTPPSYLVKLLSIAVEFMRGAPE